MAGSSWYDWFGRVLHYTGPKIASFIVEFFGTFFLVLTIGLNLDNPLAPLAIGAVLMVMIFMGGHISGAHYNPAVTFGVRLTGRNHIGTSKALVYLLMQLGGGLVAAAVAYGLCGKTFAPNVGPNSHVSQAFFAELLYTFALVSVMLNTATTKSQSSNSFFGLAIGFTVLAGAYSVGNISGGAFNPAVATGPTIIHAIVSKGEWKNLWLYWVADLLGAFFASIVFRLTNSTEYRHQAAIAHTSVINHEEDQYTKLPTTEDTEFDK